MKQLTIKDLEGIFDNILGGSAMTIITETEPDMYIENNPYKGVIKKQKFHFIFNSSYEKKMIKMNPAFVLKPSRWGTSSDNKTRELGSKTYIKVMPITTEFLGYTLNGVDVPEENIKPFLKPKRNPPVNFKTIFIENIKVIKCLGDEFQVV